MSDLFTTYIKNNRSIEGSEEILKNFEKYGNNFKRLLEIEHKLDEIKVQFSEEYNSKLSELKGSNKNNSTKYKELKKKLDKETEIKIAKSISENNLELEEKRAKNIMNMFIHELSDLEFDLRYLMRQGKSITKYAEELISIK